MAVEQEVGRTDSKVKNKNPQTAFLIHALLTKEMEPLHSTVL